MKSSIDRIHVLTMMMHTLINFALFESNGFQPCDQVFGPDFSALMGFVNVLVDFHHIQSCLPFSTLIPLGTLTYRSWIGMSPCGYTCT